MASLNEASRTNWDGKPFWGLVQQKGPWKSVSSDSKRAFMKDHPSIGGGIPAGGNVHAGHAEWMKVFTPYQQNPFTSPPEPSKYAMRSIVTQPIDMKRQTKMGRVKKGLTLGARTPVQSGEKMGLSTITENIENGQILGSMPGEVLPDLLAPSYGSGSEMSIMPVEQGGPFLSEHQVAETQEWINNTLASELRREVEAPPQLSVSRRPSVSVPPSRPALSLAQGEMVSLAPSRSRLSVTRGETVALGSNHQMEVDDVDNIIQLAVRVDQPVVQTFKPPPIHLPLSAGFLKSIADYEEGRIAKRKQVMAGMHERFARPIGVVSGQGKKQAMSAKALAKIAAERGLPPASEMSSKAFGKLSKEKAVEYLAKKNRVIPEVAKKVIKGKKINPIKKKTVQGKQGTKQQPVTFKTVTALRKRVGDTKIRSMFKAMKETNPQYNIFKAAHEKYLKEK